MEGPDKPAGKGKGKKRKTEDDEDGEPEAEKAPASTKKARKTPPKKGKTFPNLVDSDHGDDEEMLEDKKDVKMENADDED